MKITLRFCGKVYVKAPTVGNKSSNSDMLWALANKMRSELKQKERSSLWRGCVRVLSLAGLLDISVVGFVQGKLNRQFLNIKSLHPLLDAGGNICTKDEENTEIFNAFFASVFYSWISYPQGTQPPELEDRKEEQNEDPIIQVETVGNLLLHFNAHKSMRLYGTHPGILKELTGELYKPLFIIYEQFWLRKVSEDWTLANVIAVFKKGWKENPRNYWLLAWPWCQERLWNRSS